MFVLHWTAPEGRVASAELEDVTVSANKPVECWTWWFASVLAAKIITGESLTKKVVDLAARIEFEIGSEPREFEGWKFWIKEA